MQTGRRVAWLLASLSMVAAQGVAAQGVAAQGVAAQAVGTPATPVPRAAGGYNPNRLGQKTYGNVCASCHGGDQGGGRGPNLFDPSLLAALSDTQFHSIIANGIPGTEMPAFASQFSDDQLHQVIAYVRTHAADLKGKPAFVADPTGKVIHSARQSFRIDVVARGLDTPWGLAFLPDGRLLVTERPGRLRIIDRDGRLEPAAVGGTPVPWVRQDSGYLDVAVHPDYPHNGLIYLAYTEVVPGHVVTAEELAKPAPGQRPKSPPNMTVLIRGRINARNEWVTDREIFRAPASLYTPSGAHYGTRFLFDGHGHLFFALGERGDMTNAQRLDTPLGKIHRVNDDGSVPADNPFVATPGAVPTIWSYGHRNPEGLAFDPATGLLWESEHGPAGGDEINIIEKGSNYGWGVVSMGVQPGITRREAPGMVQPIVYWTPTLAPSGINFYNGKRYPGWRGNLFVAALAGQQLRRLEIKDGAVVAQEPVFEQFGRTRAVVTGPDGLLYVLLQNPTGAGTGVGLSEGTPGMVVRLVPVKAGAKQ